MSSVGHIAPAIKMPNYINGLADVNTAVLSLSVCWYRSQVSMSVSCKSRSSTCFKHICCNIAKSSPFRKDFRFWHP